MNAADVCFDRQNAGAPDHSSSQQSNDLRKSVFSSPSVIALASLLGVNIFLELTIVHQVKMILIKPFMSSRSGKYFLLQQ